MISFQPTKDEQAFVEVAYQFAKDALRPSMREIELTKQIPNNIVKEISALGLLTMEESESMGGLELPLVTQAQISRALAYGDLAIVQGLPGLNDGASFFRVLENSSKFNKLVGKNHTIAYISAVENRAFSTIQFTGSHLTGTSLPIRSVKVATHFLIAIKDEDEETNLVLLSKEEANAEVSGESYLGLEAANIGKLTFNHTNISDEHILAVGEEADKIIREAEARIYVLQASKQVGLMEATCDYVTEYTATRKAFGQEIAKFQAVSFRVAKMVLELQVTHNFVLEAANAIDELQHNAHQKAWKTINQAHEAVRYVTDSAVQLLGGHGFVREFPVEKWMRDAQAQVILYDSERNFRLAYGMELLESTEKVVVE